MRHLVATMDESGFLESERFFEMRDSKRREFAEAGVREPAHVGSGYPETADEVAKTLNGYGAIPESNQANSLVAIAAPHVSPQGGFQSYAAAYRKLGPAYADRTFVILGTSHYGEPEKFGLTRKPFVTPLGTLQTDTVMVDWLGARAPGSVVMEDYCHATEHSIEFQCLFLQHVLGRSDAKIVPILCGPLVKSLMTRQAPETDDGVRAFVDALGELASVHGNRIVWVLGIDMAHIGRRYGDRFGARVSQGPMQEVEARDRARLERICDGDAGGFFELVAPNHDDLRWCGYSPLYAFLKAVNGVRGEVLRYEQWNIDSESVVSFAGLEFRSTE
jgi:AmmeMemoRadiSam system protein B